MLNVTEMESCFTARLNQLEQTVKNLKRMVERGFVWSGFNYNQDGGPALDWLVNLRKAKGITEAIEEDMILKQVQSLSFPDNDDCPF